MPPNKSDKKSRKQDDICAPKAGKKKTGNTFCRLEDGEWYCYKMDGGQATQCSGPFATRDECEACGCGD